MNLFHRNKSYHPVNRIELSNSRLLGNVKLMQQFTNQAVIPVLKSNAYGHGIEEVASILSGADVPLVAVDGYFEANQIRHTTKHKVLVMGYIDQRNFALLNTRRVSFVSQTVNNLQAWGALGKPVNIHLELNTGMNRMGINLNEISSYLNELRKWPKLKLEGIMTHLADADNPSAPAFTNQQLELFDSAVEKVLQAGFKPKFIHISQTAGSLKLHSRYANAIRLGIGTYGINPLAQNDPYYSKLEALQPVLALKSHIVKVRELQEGDKVSYSLTFTAPKPMRIGVLPVGYYEGLPRALSGNCMLTSGSHRLPVLGRICMNHTMIDITEASLRLGSEVTVVSSSKNDPNSIISLERQHGQFPYETLTRLSSTIHRQIIE
ncbi:MAG: alanine racemase [Candidatus Nomurabacteria bacterium]|nr:alanine racemase [Candidatus Nomurabacteria bacterium]